MATVALDALGADRGPAEVVAGARLAAGDGIGIRVVGPLGQLPAAEGLDVVPAEGAIAAGAEPARAVRVNPGASIVVAAAEVAEGRADALVSAGPTGATMAAATFGIKRIRGIYRPALGVRLPVPGKPVLLLDAGANVEVRPEHLVQFAYMGAAFSSAMLGVESPRVGLLTVGEESGKGTPDVVEAHERLTEAGSLNFVGNVEGRDLPAGAADVVVTDGFTGNVSLKLMEGTAKAVGGAVRDAARSGPLSAIGGLLLRPKLDALRSQLDPDTVGGAVLIGLRKVVVVAHGSSSAEGIANAVRLADRAVREDAVERTAELLRAAGALRRAPDMAEV
jgi:glycerol-3-phosphate acyltransferase PlsX